jgi:putative peptide zinc metalloprotease protein
MIDPRVKIGPLEERAGKRYFLIKHDGTARVFRIGEKERFLLGYMDGSNDIEHIGQLYESKFRNRMTPAAWQQLFTLLAQKSLLASNGFQTMEKPPRPKGRFSASRTGLFAWNIKLVNPEVLLAKIEPKLRFLFSPEAIVFGTLLIVASELWLAVHAHKIYSELSRVGVAHWGVAAYVIPVFIVSAFIHEFSHALACQHFGGTVTDMGIVFRYLTFYPYTRLDDVMFFHSRLHRIYVFSAGMFSTLLLSAPFVVLWIAGSDPYLKAASGVIIFFLSLGTLINLIPFVQLDGYWILSSILRMPDLRQDSYIFWTSIVRRSFAKRGKRPSYSRREVAICLIYGALSAVVSLYATVAAGVRWHHLFARIAGNVYAWILVLIITGAFAAFRVKRSDTATRQGIGARVIVD